MSKAVSFPGDTGEEYFSSSTWGKSEKSLLLWMVGFEHMTPKKNMILPTTLFVKELV